ncbi:hypothetical protein ACIGO8_04910 [Streptomyces sp. NPDC053493]|uniref:hypothetical protein n=1 Tax=Streptomyces sp. NPDC053493 TaxID=3365705 RepID=UPI0037D473A7
MAEPAEPTGGQSSAPAEGGEKKEEEKPQWEQTMEDLELGIVPKLYHLFTEGGWVALATAGAIAGGALLVGAIKQSATIAAGTITRQLTSFVLPRATAEDGTRQRQTLTANPASRYGLPHLRPVDDVLNEQQQQREGAAGGGGATGENLDPDRLATLRERLTALNPQLQIFTREIAKTPKPRELNKTAGGIEKIGKAVEGVNTAKVAEVARTTGKLTGAVKHFDRDKLPKARDLKLSAQAAERLDRAGLSLQGRFAALKDDAAELAARMA